MPNLSSNNFVQASNISRWFQKTRPPFSEPMLMMLAAAHCVTFFQELQHSIFNIIIIPLPFIERKWEKLAVFLWVLFSCSYPSIAFFALLYSLLPSHHLSTTSRIQTLAGALWPFQTLITLHKSLGKPSSIWLYLFSPTHPPSTTEQMNWALGKIGCLGVKDFGIGNWRLRKWQVTHGSAKVWQSRSRPLVYNGLMYLMEMTIIW